MVTIGGGVVLDIGGKRSIEGRGLRAARTLSWPDAADAADRVALLVRESEFGMGMEELVARTGMLESEMQPPRRRALPGGSGPAAGLVCGSRLVPRGA